MTRVILEVVAVICFLGGFGLADNGWERFAFALGIFAVIATSSLSNSSKKERKNG